MSAIKDRDNFSNLIIATLPKEFYKDYVGLIDRDGEENKNISL